jgi:prepilin-type N-terminal cleavage/methylation domain-containing protein
MLRRAGSEAGFTLAEMLVVLAILLIVVGALSDVFVSASNTAIDISNRAQAQQNAVISLSKLRREIHCANAVTTSGSAPWSSLTVTFPGSSSSPATCPTEVGATTCQSSFPTTCITWQACQVGTAARYQLWRYSGSGDSCPLTTSSTGRPRMYADYLTTGGVFTACVAGAPSVGCTAPSTGNLGYVSIDLPVDVTPSTTTQKYELTDDIVLRNTTRP